MAELPVLGCGVSYEIPRLPERGRGQPLDEGGPKHIDPPDLGLHCPHPGLQVHQQELLNQYHKELQEWKSEEVRQKVEFTITDKKVKVRRPEWALNTTDLLTALPEGSEVVI